MISVFGSKVGKEELEEIKTSIENQWIGIGPKTDLFEKELAKRLRIKDFVLLDSGSNSLYMAVKLLNLPPLSEVILPALTWISCATAIVLAGHKPVFCDVETDTQNISYRTINPVLTKKTGAVMVVHYAGKPVEMDAIKSLNIPVIEDAAHAAGSELNGRKLGTFGEMSCFSFHAVKNLTTAEGGAIALNLPEPFNNCEIYKHLCVNSLHGQTKDALAKTQKGEWRYDVVEAGYKCNMTDIQASMGLVELERYDSDNLPKRKSIFDKYTAAFSKYKWAQLPLYATPDKTSSYRLYPLRIKGINEQQRDLIIKNIFDKEIAVNVHVIPVPMLHYYKSLGYDMAGYPASLDNYSREISLPVYYDLTNEQIDSVIKAVVESVNKILS